MRMVSYISILSLITAIVFSSCESDLVVTGQYTKKLVLNGIAEVGTPIAVELSTTKNVLDSSDSIDWVRNADVYLTCGTNNFPEKLLYEGAGIYSSTHIAAYSEEYTLEVVHPVYQDVSASGVMPDEPKATVRFVTVSSNDQDAVFNIEIENRDNDQFYIWSMEKKDSQIQLPENISILSTDSKTDKLLPDEVLEQQRIFLKGSEGNEVNLTSSFIAENLEESDLNNTTVTLFAMNQDMYNYYRSVELYKNSQASFIEPIEIYSNVDNGLGIFGAVSVATIEVQR